MTAMAAAADSRSDLKTAARRMTFGLALLAGATVFGLLAGVLAANGKAIDVVGLTLVLLPVALWKRPQFGPIVLLCVAVLFEQVVSTTTPQAGWVPGIGDVLPPPPLLITSHVHIFEGIGSIHLEGADLLLFMVAVVYLWRTKPAERAWPHSHVSRSMAWLLGAVLLGIFIGVSHHGQMRVALMESRPYVYLAAAYVLTATLIRTRSAMRGVLWAFVIATGLKAAQGVYEFFRVMSWHPRPEAVMGHEDAYTFGVYIFLLVALWLFRTPMGKLRKVATWILPLVIAANLFNNRRAAWLLLGGGMLVLLVIGWRCLPDRRLRLKKILVGVLIFSAGYIPAYWNKTGTLAQPARALHSMISPDVRDAASNLYRTQEDANLKYNIRQGGVLGKGFGVPIDYALPIVDISKSDPEIKFIPHNGVLYIPMRMGLLGTIAFWTLLGTGIIAGCRLARSREREMAVVGGVLAASLVAYALEGATDQGFYFYRIAFITGVFLGLAEAARRIQRTNPLAFPSWLQSPSAGPAPTAVAPAPAGMASPSEPPPEPAPVPLASDVATPLAPPRKLTLAPLPAERTLHTRLTGLCSARRTDIPMNGRGLDGHPPAYEGRRHKPSAGSRRWHRPDGSGPGE